MIKLPPGREPELIKAIMERDDEDALRELYEHYYEKIFYYAYHRINQYQDSEDVANNVFFRFWRYRKTFEYRGDNTVYAYLLIIAHNLVVTFIRNKRNIINSQFSVELGDYYISEYDPSINNLIDMDEVNGILKLANFTSREKQMFYYFIVLGMSGKECGDLFNLTKVNVRIVVYRLRTKLRKAKEIYNGAQADNASTSPSY